MIEVVVDWSIPSSGGGGVLRFYQELVPLMAKDPDFNFRAIGVDEGEAPPAEMQSVRRITPSGKWLKDGPLKRSLSQVRQGIESAYRKHRLRGLGESTLFYSVYYSLPPDPKVPTAMVVYDLICEKFEDKFPGSFSGLRQQMRLAIPKAKRLIAISECTRRDLLEIYDVPPEQVDVVHIGVRQSYFATPASSETNRAVRARLGFDGPYLLYVGGRMHHKNFTGLVHAFSKATFRKDIRLVAVGLPWGPPEKELIQKLGLESQVTAFTEAGDEQLRSLYQNASVFVYPSLYEGFGLPPLEAMASGTPVAAARAGSIPEVVGDAAALFDPEDPEDINRGIEAVLDPDQAASMKKRGLERVKEFTWERCAQKTLEVFRKTV